MKEPESHIRSDYERYSTPDPESVEDEVADLIVAFIGAMKPMTVVELGTYEGYLAQRLGRALSNDGNGHLHTFEIDKERVAKARTRCSGLPVTIHTGDANEVDPADFSPIDILIVDAHLLRRASDYMHWRSALAPLGVAMLHDTLKYNPPRSEVEKLLDNKIWLETPRGLTIVQP